MSDSDYSKPVVLKKDHEEVHLSNAKEASSHLGVVPSAVVMLIQTGRIHQGWSVKFDKVAASSDH